MSAERQPRPAMAASPSRLQDLHAASLRLLSLLTIPRAEDDLLRQGVESLASLIGARYGAIGILDEAGKLTQFVYTGITPEQAAHIGKLPEGRGLLGAVIKENHALRLDDMQSDPRSVGFPSNHPLMKSLLAVPVSHEGVVFGCVYLSEKTNAEPFTDEDEQLAARFAGALALTLHFHRSDAERRRTQNALQHLAHAVSSVTGDEFFRTLVLNLAKALNMDYAFVGELPPGRQDVVRTVAVSAKGGIANNFTYELAGTPCLNVIGKVPCRYPGDVQRQFPDDHLLREMGVESYVGWPLFGSSHQPLGLLVVMDSKPMGDLQATEAILQIGAARAASELERMQADVERRANMTALERIAGTLSASTGDTFFRDLVHGLVEALGVDYAFVGKVSPHAPEIIQTVAFCDHGVLAENIEYELAPETVCGSVECKTPCYFPEGTQKLYPEDEILSEFRVEAFFGHPLLDDSGRVQGLLAVMHGAPVPNQAHIQSILQICAARAGAEMERIRTDAEQRKLSRVVEQTDDSVLVTNRAGVIEYVNAGFEQTTGYAREEVVGRKPGLLRSGWHDEAFYRRMWSTLLRGESFRDVFVNRRKDGALQWEEKTITPLKDDGGNITHFVSTGRDITERRKSEDLTARLGRILDSSSNEIYVFDADTLHFVQANAGARRNLGYSMDELRTMTPLDLMPAYTREQLAEAIAPLARGERAVVDLETMRRRKDGSLYPAVVHLRFSAAESPPVYYSIVEDITGRRKSEDLTARLGRILDNSSNEIYGFDADTLRFVQANLCAQRNLGYSLDELRTMTPLDLKPEFTRERFAEAIAPLARGERGVVTFETAHRRKDGSLYPVEVNLQFSAAESPPVYVAIIRDITERREAQERLNYLAFYDTLTGLPNRLLLLDRLRQSMVESERHDRLAAVLFLDLDNFKLINDNLGHEAGDLLLKGVAGRLSGCVRAGDTVARFGGDEFAVVLADVAHVDDVGRMAQKILDAFTPPFVLARREVFVSTSIGITLYPFDNTDAEALLKNADTALYHAKDSGRNMFKFFTADLNARAANRLGLETALRYALEKDEFLLHYQPQVDLASGQVTGVEALIRWQRKGAGLVSPQEFIPLAEETGLIVPLGEWVLLTACAQNRSWQQAGLPPLRMSVNIAARQFQDANLAQVIIRILHETGLDPRLLVLEITESTIMHDTGRAAATLKQLAALGVGLAVDDFGVGYSSFSYLKKFPVESLKIDKSFVDDIITDPSDAAIATAIISMAHTLGMTVVAEGVETEAQLSFLRQHRCDTMQGYYFSKPLPAAAFAALLHGRKRLTLDQRRVAKRTMGSLTARSH